MTNNFAFVIPVLNNWNYTRACLNDLSKLNKENHLIVVVDNGSYDQTKNLEPYDNVKVIHNKNNLGFSKAVNLGFDLAKKEGAEIICFLNNDIKVLSDFESWTNKIKENCLEENIVSPTVGCLNDYFNFICEGKKIPSRGFWYLSGWNLSANLKTWEKLIPNGQTAPFSEDFFCFFEDTDLSFRAKKLNIPLNVIDLPVKHFGHMTAKKMNISDLYSKSKKIFDAKWTNNA